MVLKIVRVEKVMCTLCNFARILELEEAVPVRCPKCFDGEPTEWQLEEEERQRKRQNWRAWLEEKRQMGKK